MILDIVKYPHVALKTKAAPVDSIDDTLRLLLDDMVETMYANKGCGLAANQVNVLKRVFVMDCSRDQNKPICLINPVITWKSKETVAIDEGCLSFPDLAVSVSRAQQIRGEYLDEHGVRKTFDFDGIHAICVQHELDHLDGITFVDRVSPAKRQILLEKFMSRVR